MSGPLPLLAQRTAALETCGYCPKLCRAACPVSEAEPRDSLTPWGKMSLAWFVARGDVEPDRELAATAWACTGCYACRERCDHKNEVARTLAEARADYRALGLAPAASEKVVERFEAISAESSRAVEALRAEPGVTREAPVALFVGCRYARKEPAVARAAVAVAVRIFGNVRLLDGCCGAPLLHAGDRAGFSAAVKRVQAQASGPRQLVVLDPTCAQVLESIGATTLVASAHARLDLFHRVVGLGDEKRVRWHDPCHLGRGLGQYDEPRALLARLLGRAPDEFARRREEATCSGGGGLVPITMPDVSERMAARRVREHDELGAGLLVTACASSLSRFRSAGAEVVDLVSLLEASSRAVDG